MSNIEQTLSIIKPDAVERNLIDEIKKIFTKNNLNIKEDKKIHLTKEEAAEFYKVHQSKPFYNDLCAYLSSGPIVVLVLEGENAVLANRELMGATNPQEAKENTNNVYSTDSEFEEPKVHWEKLNRIPQDIINLNQFDLETNDFYDETELLNFIESTMETHLIPGLSISIAKGGNIVWENHFGYSNINESTLVDKNTMFILSSASKTVTASALMHLFEQNLFTLNDNVNDYLPFNFVNLGFTVFFSNFIFNKLNSEFNFSCLSKSASKSSLFTIPCEFINFSNLLLIILSISFFKSEKVVSAPEITAAVSFKKKFLFI